jgi:hypothetical protein
METPDLANFNVLKVKLPTGGGLYVKFKYSKTMRNEYHEIEDIQQSSVEPHPDLQQRIRSLKEWYMDVTRLKDLYQVILSERFDATEGQRKIAKSVLDEFKRHLWISQISISGKEENVGVIITGIITGETGQGMALNSHRIKLSDEIFGWEEDLKEVVEEIERECYEYIYNGKVAEPDMFADSLGDVDDSEQQEHLEESFNKDNVSESEEIDQNENFENEK